jgi:drug/metabolite transporter (DMT)-like permease
MLLPLALLHEPGRWTGGGIGAVLAIGLVMGPLGTWCIMQATTALPLVVASVGFLAGPAIGLLLSAAVLHEPLTASVLAGAGLILGGAALAAWSGR